MTYTVLSARYADADHASIVVNTKEAGDVVLSPDQTPREWAAVRKGGVHIAAYTRPSGPYRLYKSTLIRRLSEQEATVLKAVLASAPDKSQMLWEASEWLGSNDPLFGTLQAAIAQVLGAERAAEILSAED